jgi:hypothetical protein
MDQNAAACSRCIVRCGQLNYLCYTAEDTGSAEEPMLKFTHEIRYLPNSSGLRVQWLCANGLFMKETPQRGVCSVNRDRTEQTFD